METLSSILETSNIIFFLIIFIALTPLLWTRREARKLREETEKLARIIERLELEKDVYKPANHNINFSKDKAERAVPQ